MGSDYETGEDLEWYTEPSVNNRQKQVIFKELIYNQEDKSKMLDKITGPPSSSYYDS